MERRVVRRSRDVREPTWTEPPAETGGVVNQRKGIVMSTPTGDHGEAIATAWRTGTPTVEEPESPAGPLFVSGRFAAADLANETKVSTLCGTWCTRVSCAGDSAFFHVCC